MKVSNSVAWLYKQLYLKNDSLLLQFLGNTDFEESLTVTNSVAWLYKQLYLKNDSLLLQFLGNTDFEESLTVY